MKTNKISISVGLSAYNEEKNIKNVLRSILRQHRDTWILEEILVYCDGCSDNTLNEILKVKDAKIIIKNDKQRKGKVKRVQELCRDAKGEILFIFDCDLTFKDDHIISNMVVPFIENNKVVLVGGNTRPFMPKTFMEKAVYSTFLVFDKSRNTLKNGNNIFGCTGGCISIRTSFGKNLVFPPVFNEDDFMYFSTIKAGYEFRYIKESVVYYKLPKKLFDYLRQIFRSNPESVSINFKKYFGDLPKKEYKRTFIFYGTAIIESFIKFPLETIFITLINLLAKPFFRFISGRYKISWYTAKSTK